MSSEIMLSPEHRPAGGHYSQAVKAAGLIFVSGQLGITRLEAPDKPLVQQVEDVLTAVEDILKEAGATLSDVVKVDLYVDDIAHWDTIDEIYSTRFGSHRPARVIVPAKGLHFGSALEISVIAADPAPLLGTRT